MPKKYKERSLIEFQKDFQIMKLAQSTLWSNDGQMDLFAHAADIMKLGTFPSDNCSTAKFVDFRQV